METGKTGKYFKYAIGEIILVVIGILIALQLNNWNEGRSNRNSEIKTLAQLNIDLKSNLNEIISLKENITFYSESGIKILNNLDSNNVVTDSLKFWVEIFGGRNIFNNANTTYKAIQNNTKNSITSDSLRLKVTLMYEQDFDNIHKREQILNEEFFKLYTLELHKNFKIGTRVFLDDGDGELVINTPINLEQLKTNERYKNTLVDTYNFRQLRIRWLTQTIEELKVLIKEIDLEIEHLKTL